MTMSMKEIFNKVEKHLLEQNAKSIREGDNCQYRSDEGLSCAVGCLMTDDMYDYSLEGESVRSEEVREALTPIVGVNEKKRKLKLNLLYQLQNIHDDTEVAQWGHHLKQCKLDFHIS
jgi:hypothetical protein